MNVKKTIIIVATAVLLLVALFTVFILLTNKNINLVNEEYASFKDLMYKLSLSEKQVQLIPENYTMLGDPYGIYYKTDKKHLTELWIYNVDIHNVPSEVRDFPKLKKLVIKNSSMVNLGEGFGLMENLEELILSNNKIKSFESIIYFPNLKRLDLSYNNISHLTETLGEMKKLEYLNLEGNDISALEHLEFESGNFCFCEKKNMYDRIANYL
ncbi:MAG: leucine-rich repeat domain-containing protein, partial [bacterium]